MCVCVCVGRSEGALAEATFWTRSLWTPASVQQKAAEAMAPTRPLLGTRTVLDISYYSEAVLALPPPLKATLRPWINTSAHYHPTLHLYTGPHRSPLQLAVYPLFVLQPHCIDSKSDLNTLKRLAYS